MWFYSLHSNFYMARSEQVYDFVRNFIGLNGYAPTRREIAAGCGIASTRTVQIDLIRLGEAGLIKIKPRVSRSIVLADRSKARH